MTHLLIIGGSDAGISAALRAREVDTSVEVTVVVADRFPNYSICGLPLYLKNREIDRKPLDARHRGEARVISLFKQSNSNHRLGHQIPHDARLSQRLSYQSKSAGCDGTK